MISNYCSKVTQINKLCYLGSVIHNNEEIEEDVTKMHQETYVINEYPQTKKKSL